MHTTQPRGPQANHTQREILGELRRAGGSLRIGAIARTLNVSEETVRRNVKRLADDGIVEKVHGGARLLEEEVEDSLAERLAQNPDAKRRIARSVAGMIPQGSSLFLDVGSTTAYIADALRDHRGLMVVTNSVYAAYRLATRNDNRVFMAGGELRPHDGGSFGADAMAFAGGFHTEFAVLSAAGIDARRGFLLHDLEEARFSRLILTKAARRIMAADASKFGRLAPVVVCEPSLVDDLVCETDPPAAIRSAAGEWGTRIHVAP